ncbi:GNAT family N-acetyltransferase [Lysobacter sp. A378]
MLIREYIPGEEAILREVFLSSVHQLARTYYTPEQINAWAPATYDRNKWREKIATIRPFVAVVGSRVAGYADLQASGYIDHFFVSGEFSHRGVGSGLMRHIHDVAEERGLPKLIADVSLAAEEFFTWHGFVVNTRQSVAVMGVALSNAHMVKELLPNNSFKPNR